MDYLKFWDQFKIYEDFNLSDLLIGDSTWYPVTDDDWREIIYKVRTYHVETITDIESKHIKSEINNICDRFNMKISEERMYCYRSVINCDYAFGIGEKYHIVFHKFKDEYWLVGLADRVQSEWVNRWICDGLIGITHICDKNGGISEDINRHDNVSESYSSNHYWSEIDLDEWNDLTYNVDLDEYNMISLTDKEIECIRELSCEMDMDSAESHGSNLYPHGWDTKSFYKSTDAKFKTVSFLINGYESSNIEILKLPDEWYMVSQEWSDGKAFMYKCDQFDGLCKLIKYLYGQ